MSFTPRSPMSELNRLLSMNCVVINTPVYCPSHGDVMPNIKHLLQMAIDQATQIEDHERTISRLQQQVKELENYKFMYEGLCK